MKKKGVAKVWSLFITLCMLITMFPIFTYADVKAEMPEIVGETGEEIQKSLMDDVADFQTQEELEKALASGEAIFVPNASIVEEQNENIEEERVGVSASDVVSVAKSQVGVSGVPNTYTRWLGTINGSYSYAWCHAFVSWCANQAGAGNLVPRTASCASGVAWFQKAGRWKARSSGYTPQPGDIIYFDWNANGGYDHVGIVNYASGGRVYTIEGNARNAVKYNGGYANGYSMSDNQIIGYGVPAYNNSSSTTGHSPVGYVDEIKTGPNYVYVHGWAFDEDAKTQPLNIHVYSRNSSGEAKGLGSLSANLERVDVGNAYPGVGNYHGFEGKLSAPAGSQTIEVYGINVGGGNNALLQDGKKAVTVTADTDIPQITDVSVTLSSINLEGYTVKCKVSDNGKIKKIQFPSWHSSQGGDKAVWFEGNVNDNGIASYRIPVSQLGNYKGLYYTNIYAYDYANNCAVIDGAKSIGVEIDTTPITSMKAIDLGNDFYASIENKGVNKAITANGYKNSVVSKSYQASTAQRWHFTKNSDGTYRIKNVDTGYSLDNYEAKGTKGSKIVLHEDNDSNAQKWQIYQAPENSYFIKPICSTDCVMDLANLDDSEGALIQMHTYNYSYAQRFEINKMNTPVESVAIDRTELTFTEAGRTHTLSAAITPSDATNQKITWSSSNASVAKVDASGKVTAVSNGTAVITARTDDGNKTATCTVTVSIPVAVTGISLNSTQLSFTEVGEASRLTATITPQNATNQKVTYTSSNPEVAVADSNGLITAVSDGTATITARTQDGGKTAVCKVTVDIPVKVTGVQIDQTQLSFTAPGETKKLTAKVLPTNADNQKVTFQSADTSVAMVMADGTVKATGNGQTKITVTSADGGYTASCTVTVNIPEAEVTVTMSQTELTLEETGQSVQLSASVTPESDVAIRWESSHPEVAVVDSSGVVTAVSAGETVITASAEEKNSMAMCHVTVNISVPVETVTLSETNLKFYAAGEARKLTAAIAPENATDKTIIWESSNTSVAEVSVSGLVTAHANGSAAIVAKTAEGSQSAICFVTVNIPVKVTGITLDQTELTLTKIGETRQLYAKLRPSDADNQKVNWTSSDESVVTVDSNGMVTAVSDGYAVIMAVTADGNKMAFCSVTVSVPTAVQGISLNKTQISLKQPKATAQLLAMVIPSGADNKEVKFTSSNPEVATVDASGLVIAEKNGTAVITAETKDGGFTAACTVFVDIPVLVEEIRLNHEKVILKEKGETLELSASIIPTNADNQEVDYSSSDTRVVTVDANGFVTAVSSGFATIMVISADGNCSSVCQITVELPGEVLPPDPTVTPEPGNPQKPTITPEPTNPPKPTATPTLEKNDVGAKFISKGIIYKVVSDTKTEKAVHMIGIYKERKNIKIPVRVCYNSKMFLVTAIAKKACKGKTKVKKVVIGKNVTTIGTQAFYGCRNLKTVTIKGKNLKTVGKGAFKKLSGNTVIKVPKKMKKKYRKLLQGRLSSGVTIK